MDTFACILYVYDELAKRGVTKKDVGVYSIYFGVCVLLFGITNCLYHKEETDNGSIL